MCFECILIQKRNIMVFNSIIILILLHGTNFFNRYTSKNKCKLFLRNSLFHSHCITYGIVTKKVLGYLPSVFTSMPYKVKQFTFIPLQEKKVLPEYTYILNIFPILPIFMLLQTQKYVKTRTKTLFVMQYKK